MRNEATLELLRSQWLAFEGDDLVEIHGWLIGVACAIERKSGRDPQMMDRLIAELRQSSLKAAIP